MSIFKIIFFLPFTSLFIYSFTFAGKIELLYQHKTINGIEWEIFGDPRINPIYEGEVVNMKPHGSGKLIYSSGNNFEGFWKDGELNGEGTFFWNDGKKYIGLFKNGKPIGMGKYVYKDGSEKKGNWEDTQKKFLWTNKSSETIDSSNKKNGILSYRKENALWGWFDYGDEKNDGKYIGEIKNLKPNGLGTFTYGNGRWKGDTYEGMWENGQFNGKGTLTRKSGEKFVGEWRNNNVWNINKYNKFGKILRKFENGIEVSIKKGITVNKKNEYIHKKKGILFMHTPRYLWEDTGKKWTTEGDEKKHGKYEGEIINGLPNGHGEYSWFNVNKYIGEFKNGMFHGKGVFYSLPSKIKVEGEFRKDKEWNAIQIDGKGNIIGKFVLGELRK